MELVIDSREPPFFKTFFDHSTCSTLETGDFEIRDGSTPVALFERKTLADLASSIKDGRYHSQRERLMNAQQNIPIVGYIFEGESIPSPDSTFCNIPSKSIWSTMVNVSGRDKLTVFRSCSKLETCHFLATFLRNYKKWSASKRTFSLIQRRPRLKKEPLLVKMLCQIDRVSSSTANAIYKKFKTYFPQDFKDSRRLWSKRDQSIEYSPIGRSIG